MRKMQHTLRKKSAELIWFCFLCNVHDQSLTCYYAVHVLVPANYCCYMLQGILCLCEYENSNSMSESFT